MTNSSFLRFERFRITEVSDLDQVSQLQLVGNDISPYDVRIVVGSDLLIENNTFHDLTMRIDAGTGRCIAPRCGYGVRINRGTNVTIRNNRFQRIPADGIQSGTAVWPWCLSPAGRLPADWWREPRFAEELAAWHRESFVAMVGDSLRAVQYAAGDRSDTRYAPGNREAALQLYRAQFD